jgi:hypothetical protein
MDSNIFWEQAPTVAPVMLSSGSDTSPEASPTRTSTSRKQSKGEKHASPDHARDRDGASQNKNKISAATRRKNLVSKKGRTNVPAFFSTIKILRHDCLRS